MLTISLGIMSELILEYMFIFNIYKSNVNLRIYSSKEYRLLLIVHILLMMYKIFLGHIN